MPSRLRFRPSPGLLVGCVALFVALGGAAVAVTPTSTQSRIFFSSSAGNPSKTILNLDGLQITAQCIPSSGGKPRFVVMMRSTVAGASMQLSYTSNILNVRGGGQNEPSDMATALNSTLVPMFGTDAEYPTDGSQLSGTFTYTTPSGTTVTATYQWWVGDTTPPPTGGNCLFSGIATGS